jgi:hypothetical protein
VWNLFLDPFWLIKVPVMIIIVAVSVVAIYIECFENRVEAKSVGIDNHSKRKEHVN